MNIGFLATSGLFYMLVVWYVAPRHVSVNQFFTGKSNKKTEPAFLLLAASAAISWIFAKSIVNSAALTHAFGLWGGFGYAIYYLSFIVVAVTIYFLRVHGGYRSLPNFISTRYGALCMKLFIIAIAIRLFNEVWSNTKVVGLFFWRRGWRRLLAGGNNIHTFYRILYTQKRLTRQPAY
jgi:Na+/proline symporter